MLTPNPTVNPYIFSHYPGPPTENANVGWDGVHRPLADSMWSDGFTEYGGRLKMLSGVKGWDGGMGACETDETGQEIFCGDASTLTRDSAGNVYGASDEWARAIQNMSTAALNAYVQTLKYQSPGTYTAGNVVYRQPTGGGNLLVGGGTANLGISAPGLSLSTMVMIGAALFAVVIVSKK